MTSRGRGGSPVSFSPQAWTLIGAAFLVAVGYGLIAPILPVLARSFGVSVTATSTLISAFAAVRVVSALLSGWTVARFGELPVLCCGLLVVGASSAACALATDFVQLLMLRAAGGVGSTFFTVSSDLILIRVSHRSVLARVSAAWSGAFLVGGVAGPVVGVALAPWGLRTPFVVYGGVLVVVAVLAGARLGRRAPAPTPQGSASSTTFRGACRVGAFRAALVGNFVEGWMDHGVRLLLAPLVVTESLGRAPECSAIALTAFAAGTASGLPVGGWLADRRGRRPAAMLGCAVLGGSTIGLAASTTIAPFLVSAVISGIGTGLATPAANAAVGDLLAEHDRGVRSGSAMAGFQMAGDAGAVLGPLVVGAAVDLGGSVSAFGTAAVVTGVSFLVWLQVPERHGR